MNPGRSAGHKKGGAPSFAALHQADLFQPLPQSLPIAKSRQVG